MKHGFFAKRLTLCLTALLLLGVCVPCVPALAEYTPVALSTYPVTYDVYFVMDKNVDLPVTNFYMIGATVTVPVAPDIIVGPPSSTGDYPGFDVTDFIGPSATVVTSAAEQGDDVLGVPIDYSTQKYAKKTYTLKPHDVTFSKPGVYRYGIKHNCYDPTTNNNISQDPIGELRYMDVYVVNSENALDGLEIASVSIHSPTDTTKTTGYTHVYTSNVLTINKTVTGNQGDKDEYFKFTITIDNGVHWADSLETHNYYVSVSPGSFGPTTATPPEENLNATALYVHNKDYTGPAVDTYYIKHGQTITVRGMNHGTAYTVTEYPVEGSGYTTTYTVDNGDSTTGTATPNYARFGNDDSAVVFTNTRQGTVPTGILLDVAPYALLVLFAGAALLLITRRRAKAIHR